MRPRSGTCSAATSGRSRRGLARLHRRDRRGRRRHGVLDSPRGEPLPLHRRRSLRPRRGDAPGDRRAGRHRHAPPGQGRRKAPAASRSRSRCSAANHKITTPRHRFELIQMEAVSERVKADHAAGRRLRGRRAGHHDRDRDVRQHVGQHGRAQEVGPLRPAGPAPTTRPRPTAWCCGTPRPASSSRACP